jgi:hypothetical protein
MTTSAERRKDLRRSTRVPIQVQIKVDATGVMCDGETVVVNLHGALLRTAEHLEIGDHITLKVSLTGKSAAALVVFAAPEHALHFGIALDAPENIWGISLPPADWETRLTDTGSRKRPR